MQTDVGVRASSEWVISSLRAFGSGGGQPQQCFPLVMCIAYIGVRGFPARGYFILGCDGGGLVARKSSVSSSRSSRDRARARARPDDPHFLFYHSCLLFAFYVLLSCFDFPFYFISLSLSSCLMFFVEL